jgi:ERCC4-related helicase
VTYHAILRQVATNTISAHNCVGKHPGSKIMTDYYHQNRLKRWPIPHILGLTASPIISSKLESMDKLEETLHAICKSPHIHRDELLATVKRPNMSYISYQTADPPPSTSSIKSLEKIHRQMDIAQDPFVLSLKHEGTDRSRRTLQKAIEKHDTRSLRQMRSFCRSSQKLSEELGTWAADYYISEVVSNAERAAGAVSIWYDKWLEAEKTYVADLLRKVNTHLPRGSELSPLTTSAKFRVLLKLLMVEEGEVFGIIFVRERNTVAVLSHMLTRVAEVNDKYRISTATAMGKRDLWDISQSMDAAALRGFRTGKVNLLIATSVLEEGIDVPACNLVICFDEPPNLKSFIQRRGRARMRDSRLVVLIDANSDRRAEWQRLEEQMKERYADQERELQRMQDIEESEDAEGDFFVVESTGARLDYDNAKQHLDHFCKILSPGEYVDSRPDYIVEPTPGDASLLSCRVLLPTYVPQHVREAHSARTWAAEKNATKDAAFQAYLALYKAELINQNLLPFRPEDFFPNEKVEEGLVLVGERWDPWPRVAMAWERGETLWSYLLTLRDENGTSLGEYYMVLPVDLPLMKPISLYMDQRTTWTIDFSKGYAVPAVARGTDHTSTLLALHFSHRWPSQEKAHVVRFVAKNASLSMDGLGAVNFDLGQTIGGLDYLIRDRSGCPYIYDGYLPMKPPPGSVQRPFNGWEEAPSDVPYLILKKWTRRADFLHPVMGDPNAVPGNPTKLYGRVYPAPWTRVDTVPMAHAKFGMLIPSILHVVETYLVAMRVCSKVLKPLAFDDVELALTAISARSAAEPRDYERLEFLGDSLLKFCVTVNVAAERECDKPQCKLCIY